MNLTPHIPNGTRVTPYPIITNPDKLYFPKEEISKGEVIEYYIRIAPYLMPHLKDRPFSMICFPNGEVARSFYQKQCPPNAPSYIETVTIPSSKRGTIDWIQVNNIETLVYLVNRGVLEMHAWFSRSSNLHMPDIAAIDIDPPDTASFSNAVIVAQAFHTLLYELKISSFPKTSGSKGIHIYIPLKPVHTYKEVQSFLSFLSATVQKALPKICTTERMVQKRNGKVYLDTVQCGYGKTLAAPYSLRVRPNAPISTPLHWSEVTPNLKPTAFTLNNIFTRLSREGDLISDLTTLSQSIPKF